MRDMLEGLLMAVEPLLMIALIVLILHFLGVLA